MLSCAAIFVTYCILRCLFHSLNCVNRKILYNSCNLFVIFDRGTVSFEPEIQVDPSDIVSVSHELQEASNSIIVIFIILLKCVVISRQWSLHDVFIAVNIKKK